MLSKGFVAAAGALALLGAATPAVARDRDSDREQALAEAMSMANHPTDPAARIAGRIALGELRPQLGRAQREAVDQIFAAAEARPVQAVCEVVSVDAQGVVTAQCHKRPEPPLTLGME